MSILKSYYLKQLWQMLLLMAVLLLSMNPAFSQTSPTSPAKDLEANIIDQGQPALRTFTDLDGLPQNSIMCMTFDHRGYLWVGTQDGAAYYTGHGWNIVNMPNKHISNYVRTMIKGADSSLWFGTLNGGLIRLKDGQWTIFNKENSPLPDNKVRCLWETVTKDGRSILWIGTYEEGLARYENGKWTLFNKSNSGLPENGIQSVYETVLPDGRQTLWVGTFGSGLCRYENDRWTLFNTTNSQIPDNSVHSLLETISPQGYRRLWVGFYNSGLARYENGQWFAYNSKNSQLFSNSVTRLLRTVDEYGQETIWAGLFGGGVARFDGDRLSIYNKKNFGLSDDGVLTMAIKQTNNRVQTLWIGTLSGGLIRFQDNGWRKVDYLANEKDSVSAILESRAPDGSPSLWLGTNSNGLRYWQQGNWRSYNTDNSPLPNNHIRALLETKSGALWICTSRGLARFENGNWTLFNTKNSDLAGDNTLCLLETTSPQQRPIIWVGMVNKGLARYEDDQWTFLDTDNSGLPNHSVLSMIKTPTANGGETIWVGTGGGGLGRFENGKWTTYNSTNSPLPNDRILSLLATRSADNQLVLWVGTAGGACRFEPNRPESKWLVFTDSSEPALTSHVINSIIEDEQKQIYLGTYKGVTRLTPRLANPTRLTDFNTYTYLTEDGLPGNGVNALLINSRHNRLWVGTFAGLATLDLLENNEDNSVKPLYIERFLINKKRYSGPQNDYIGPTGQIGEELQLAYHDNNILVEYSLLNYFKESETRYRTQLEGFDRDPSDWSTDIKREYTNLAEGRYLFKVWGRDYAGNISGPVLIRFRIKPAPWHTWPAYFIYTISLGLIGYGGVRLRLMVLQRRTTELEQIVQERTAEIVRQNEQLRWQNDEIETKSNKIIDSIRYAERIQQAILPEQERIGAAFAQHFILFKPKDIVSGDFYWFREKNGVIIFAVADCTGHGVPGAFMSMISNALLNQIVIEQGITDPARILEELHRGIRLALKQSAGQEESQDGMDIALCRFDFINRQITFAGAKRPLYYIDRVNLLTEIKGNRRSVGGKQRELQRIFTNHQLSMHDVAMVYLTTDGFADQNGPGLPKYGNNRLKRCLQANCKQDLATQYRVLLDELTQYQQNEPQRDDITIVAIKIDRK